MYIYTHVCVYIQCLLPSLLFILFSFYYFPGGTDSKESDYNAGTPSSIPGSGRSPGEENGIPLQYSCLEIPWTEEPGRLHTVHGVAELEVISS